MGSSGALEGNLHTQPREQLVRASLSGQVDIANSFPCLPFDNLTISPFDHFPFTHTFTSSHRPSMCRMIVPVATYSTCSQMFVQ